MYRDLTSRLHMIARSTAFRLVITGHAEKQMRDRDVTRFEVEKVLKAGAVVMVETGPAGQGAMAGRRSRCGRGGGSSRWVEA